MLSTILSIASVLAISVPVSQSAAVSMSSLIHPIRGYQPGYSPFSSEDEYIKYKIGTNVLTGPINVYYVYYGNWTYDQKSILEDFGNRVGDSDWYKIQKSMVIETHL